MHITYKGNKHESKLYRNIICLHITVMGMLATFHILCRYLGHPDSRAPKAGQGACGRHTGAAAERTKGGEGKEGTGWVNRERARQVRGKKGKDGRDG